MTWLPESLSDYPYDKKDDVVAPQTWYLAITPEQFKEIYGDKVEISIFTKEPKDDSDLLTNFMCSKLWRLNNLYTIVDKYGERIPFRMNLAQHKVYAASLEHPRLIILKSRQQGISTFWLISFLDDATTLPDVSVGLMAQGKSEASTLLKRVKIAWNSLSTEYKSFMELGLKRDNTEEVEFTNGATMFIRVSFRSTTLQRLHISEFGKIANANPGRVQETKTGTLQAIRPGNIVVIESTAEGDNEFNAMWGKAEVAEQRRIKLGLPKLAGKDFKPVFLSWLDDPDCVSSHPEVLNQTQQEYFEKLEGLTGRTITPEQRWFWVAQYRELGDAIYQEYPATPDEAFTRVHDGSYYGPLYLNSVVKKGHIKENLFDPNLEVHVALDLGIHDTFVLGYFQKWRSEYRIIDEYFNHGEGLEFYVTKIRETGYPIGTVICPHDIEVTELGMGKSRKARLRELGVTNIKVVPRTAIVDGIEQVRKAMPNIYLDERCTYLDGCFKNYSKEWDDVHGVWKNRPLHDKWSHGADMIRTMILGGIDSANVLISGNADESRSSGVHDGLSF